MGLSRVYMIGTILFSWICFVIVTISIFLGQPSERIQHIRAWAIRRATAGSMLMVKQGAGGESALFGLESAVEATSVLCESIHGTTSCAPNDLNAAVDTMQARYFELWLGTWPEAIDWTAAVMATHLSAALHSMTKIIDCPFSPSKAAATDRSEVQTYENQVNKYFSQIVTYYFGEDAFAIRMQAYDDMLWVVLGWLEQIRFINSHTNLHHRRHTSTTAGKQWHGKQFESTFAHRARIFYDLATHGWDTRLCGGGMIWNPVLEPYKNAITNELFISASIGMYLYFPGDNNTSPFLKRDYVYKSRPGSAEPHDPKYLEAAVNGYAWLTASNMTNTRGLFVDGFHISGWSHNGSVGTGQCDARNEMVYTYNQGVLLSGLRGLWEATGRLSYLEDGHALVRAVIASTGWELQKISPEERGHKWEGLGRNGVLEEFCDAAGTCSQDGQTFKGIFFHHLTLFCELLPRKPRFPGRTVGATPAEAMLHRESCIEYEPWVSHNAHAALQTRDQYGLFGMWWGAPSDRKDVEMDAAALPEGALDYRNHGEDFPSSMPHNQSDTQKAFPNAIHATERSGYWSLTGKTSVKTGGDLNDRGRGRTVETQGTGLAVVRAMWEFSKLRHIRD